MPSPALQPTAGPSRPTPSRLPTSLSDPLFPFHRASSTLSSAPTTTSSSARSSTPLVPPTARFRSGSVFSREQYKKEELARRRQESRDRLKSTWELLFEKYKDIGDDDEIDLQSMQITKDSGVLRSQSSRDFGRVGESEDEEESAAEGPEVYEFDSDEDELGDWDDRSGLDPQQPEWEDEVEQEEEGKRWTAEDREDFAEFMRMEEQRRRMNEGEDEEGEGGETESEQGSNEGALGVGREPKRKYQAREPTPPSPRSLGTRFLPVPTLADLFTSDDDQSSEDELQAINPLVEDETTRKTPAPPAVKHTKPEARSSRRRRLIVEVVIPTRRRSLPSSGSRPPPLRDLTYHTLLGSTPASSLPSPSLDDLFTPPPSSLALQTTFPSHSAFTKGKQRMVGECPGEDARVPLTSLPDTPYCKTLQRTLTGKLYQCVHCLKARGERAERAEWCKGRRGDCLFESTLGKGEKMATPQASLDAEPGFESSTPRPGQAPLTRGISVGRAPICRLCREAGGDRAKGARACPGGKGWRRCTWEKKKKADAEAAAAATVESDEDKNEEYVESGHDTKGKSAVPLGVARPEQLASMDDADEKEKPQLAPRRATERVVRSVSDSDDRPRPKVPDRWVNRKRILSPNLAAPPSPPPTSSVPPSSPPRLSWSRSPLQSLPPSSPPVPVENLRSPGAPRQHAHPTPSPSISASNVGLPSSPVEERTLRTVAVSARTSAPYHFTPSPSNDGLRSRSISGNPSVSTPLKSALRRPSDAPLLGPPSSVKRARFSIVPRSPVRDVSSSDDDDDDNGSEDELDLLSSGAPPPSSPVPGSSSPAIQRYASTSNPPRDEWTVRAADVGFRLGPEHTGSLPSKMVQALAPSLGNFRRPMLGSSSFSSLSGGNYALPTPPPSFGPSSLRPSPGPKPGLMLPPPVPAKRLPNPTPAPPPSSPVRIQFTSLPAVVVRAQVRARSQSLSAPPLHLAHSRASRAASTAPRAGYTTPAPRAASEARRVQSTPTRKSRLVMRQLERAAAEAGDEAGLEWGLDEEADDGGRMWREGSVRTYVS